MNRKTTRKTNKVFNPKVEAIYWSVQIGKRQRQVLTTKQALGLPPGTIALKVYFHPELGRVCIPGDAIYRVTSETLVHCADDR